MNQTEIKRKRLLLLTGMLGFITMLLLAKLIGDLGMAYLAAALEVYVLLQLLFTASVPDYVEKMIRSRMAKEQFKNADKVCKAAFIYSITAGGILCLLLLLFAGVLTEKILGIPEAALAMRILAPAFLLNAVCAVLQGYFQGLGTAMPTAVSGIVKQIFCLSFSVMFGYMLYGYGEKASALLHNDRFSYMYGAAGAAVGLLCAVFLAMVFLLFVFLFARMSNRGGLKRRRQEGMRLTEDGLEVFRLLLAAMLPAAGMQFLFRLPTLLGILFYQGGQQEADTLFAYGAYYGKYLIFAGMVTVLALFINAGVENTVIHAVKREEYKSAKSSFAGGMQSILLLTGFIAAQVCGLAPYIMQILFGENEGSVQAAACLRHGFLLLLLLPMAVYFAHILTGIGKAKNVLVNLLTALVFYIVTAIAGLGIAKGSILALVYAQLVFAAVYAAMNGIFLFRAIRYNPEWFRGIALPLLAAFLSGFFIFLVSRQLSALLGDGGVVLACSFAGGLCYLILIFIFRCIRERDLDVIPGGGMLRRIGKLLHLL